MLENIVKIDKTNAIFVSSICLTSFLWHPWLQKFVCVFAVSWKNFITMLKYSHAVKAMKGAWSDWPNFWICLLSSYKVATLVAKTVKTGGKCSYWYGEVTQRRVKNTCPTCGNVPTVSCTPYKASAIRHVAEPKPRKWQSTSQKLWRLTEWWKPAKYIE